MQSQWVWSKVFKEILKDRARIHDSYRSVFQSANGQVVLSHMMKKFGVTTPSFVQGDAQATAFKEGQRHVVLTIMKFINKNQEELAAQIQQHIEDE